MIALFLSLYPAEAGAATVTNTHTVVTITTIQRMGLPSYADHSGGTSGNTLDMRYGCHRQPVAAPGMFEARNPTLTRRQLQVLELASRGHTVQETAVELGIGAETVKTHRKRVLQELGARTTHEAVARAFHTYLL